MSQHHRHGPECGHLEKLIYSRRELLGRLGGGIAGLAFADLLSQQGLLAPAFASGFGGQGQQGLRPGVNPLAPKEPHRPGAKAKAVDYEFHPEPGALLDDLLPAVARVRPFQAFLDATVSEHIARMVAMKAATEASEEMIKTLSRQYNRARQTQITMELLDIVGGANALA